MLDVVGVIFEWLHEVPASIHAAASDEVESITKEDPKIDAAITKDAPWLRWA
jgi:hypothetical protein